MLRLYGVLFHENNIDKIYRLASGVTRREHINDPQQSPRGVYTVLSLDSSNQDIKVELLEGADDIRDASDLNPNDSMRIRIMRDTMCIFVSFFQYFDNANTNETVILIQQGNGSRRHSSQL